MRINSTAGLLISAVLFALAGSVSSDALAAGEAPGDVAKGRKIAERVCYFCHGLDGRGVKPGVPMLAGQHTDYLIKQLTRFQSGGRDHFIMTDITSRLTPQDMRDVAAYMNSQVPHPEKPRKAGGPLVEAIFLKGRPADGLPACQTCHGPRGAGQAALMFPRLAGQRAEYVLTQLKAFKSNERYAEPGNPMHEVALKLSDQEMEGLANYVAGLD